MKIYNFALIFKLEQDKEDINIDDYLDRLYEAGCDDAIIGEGQPGYIVLDFIRESNTAFGAIESAINNVKSVLVKAELIHVSPDLVGVKELADIFECTRRCSTLELAKFLGVFRHYGDNCIKSYTFPPDSETPDS